ncbi:hypothetical protein I4U23_015052 [Adineta vaga]|nr:hypothetical protein I4U23_015052 [Adineta vaga]
MIRSCYFAIFFLCFIFLSIEGNNTRQPNAVIRISNMTQSMSQDAVRISKQAFIKYNGYSSKSRSSIAHYIRTQFDQLHQPTWQCILGNDYALSITSENEKRIILDIGKVAILIFKSKC